MKDPLLEEIDRGREGLNQGFSLGLPKLEDLTDGLTKSTDTLLFAGTGVGKASAMLYAYVYKPIMEHLDDGKLEIILFALEMAKTFVEAKLMSIYIKEHFNYTLTAKVILGRKKGYRMTDEEYNYVLQTLPWIQKVRRIFHIVERRVSSDGAYRIILETLENNGIFTDLEHHTGYVPNNPDKVLLTITDHMGLLKTEGGRNKKGEIDRYSSMQVSIRNRTGMSFLNLMQINRAGSSMDRKRLGFNEPMIDDIKESGGPSEDSEIILALYNPQSDHLSTYREYDAKKLGSHCRSWICLKNRYGESNAADVCYFDGATGIFKELPSPEEINDYDNIFSDNINQSDNHESDNQEENHTDLTFIL